MNCRDRWGGEAGPLSAQRHLTVPRGQQTDNTTANLTTNFFLKSSVYMNTFINRFKTYSVKEAYVSIIRNSQRVYT